MTLLVLAALGLLGAALAALLWPAADPQDIVHDHPDLDREHPHLRGGGHTHRHAYVIDDLHIRWPGSAR